MATIISLAMRYELGLKSDLTSNILNGHINDTYLTSILCVQALERKFCVGVSHESTSLNA